MAINEGELDTSGAVRPAPPTKRALFGWLSLFVAALLLLIMTFLPVPYVIQRPGPVYNTLGTAQNSAGEQVPLIEISGVETYPTSGQLDLLTVNVRGNRENSPTWAELAYAWFSPAQAILPMDAVFPRGQTTAERNEQNQQLMVSSQSEATAAALLSLGYEVDVVPVVSEFVEGSTADGVLHAGDQIISANGKEIDEAEELRDVISASNGEPISIVILRDGIEQTVTVSPALMQTDEGQVWRIGVIFGYEFVFPFDVKIQIDQVGGPSAGMMFALGIIDKLTPGELNGGKHIAGTGTMSVDGTVGKIGGIRQKMVAARDAGATVFLAPAGNCSEVVGHTPEGIEVFAVEDLDDALEVLGSVRDGSGLDELARCTS